MYYIGLDVHKQKISYCVKDSSGKIYAEGWIPATRFDLDRWMKTLPQPWSAALEATMFSGWIYDHLKPHAAALKVAHPLMLRAIAAAKKKNDRIDANKICDCLRCDFLPECYMAPTAIRERRRTLRYRNLLVRQMVQMKIKISTLLMEAGVSYNKQKLHKAGYFRELLTSNPDIGESLRSLLCRLTGEVPPTTAVRGLRLNQPSIGSLASWFPQKFEPAQNRCCTFLSSRAWSLIPPASYWILWKLLVCLWEPEVYRPGPLSCVFRIPRHQ
jgi:hypothetical protein